ncbi:MAG: helix-hairpin-helix domain-containing protein [Candidatus Helarchaeota archaeon]
MSIELENIDGIGAKTAEQLKEEGIMNALILASTTVRKLKALGFSDSSARKWIEKARDLTNQKLGGQFGFIMGDSLLKQFNERLILKTGQPVLDKVLGGGFETQKVYEIYGPEGSGKSTLLHQLICISKLPVSKGGLGSPATIFLDCEGAMSIKKLEAMAPFWGISPEEAIKSIARANPPTSQSLVYLCEENLPKIMEQTGAKLILLDSIATHFRSEYGQARQLFPERQQRANRILHALKHMAVNYNALVVLTNQVTGNVDAMNKYSKKYSHSMGYIVGHESQVRILIEPIGEFRRVKIEKAVDLPNDYCNLVMTQYGLLDPLVIKEKGIKAPSKKGNEILITPMKNDEKKTKKNKKNSINGSERSSEEVESNKAVEKDIKNVKQEVKTDVKNPKEKNPSKENLESLEDTANKNDTVSKTKTTKKSKKSKKSVKK